MKTIITVSFAGALMLAATAAAKPASTDSKPIQSSASVEVHQELLNLVSQKIKAEPSTAAQVVKQAIIESKADAELVLQIVKSAVLAAPDQADAVAKVALALAPDVQKEVQIVITSVLEGDQVAQAGSDRANMAADAKKNAAKEPEGRAPEKNTVWLTNRGAFNDGYVDLNSLPSKVQDTAVSPNVNHNQGAFIQGGVLVVIRPNPTTDVISE